MHVGREPFRNRDLFDDSPHAPRCETSAALVDQQGAGILSGFAKQRLPRRKILAQSAPYRIAERNVPLLLSFPSNQDRFRAHAAVVEINPCQFRVPNSTAIE